MAARLLFHCSYYATGGKVQEHSSTFTFCLFMDNTDKQESVWKAHSVWGAFRRCSLKISHYTVVTTANRRTNIVNTHTHTHTQYFPGFINVCFRLYKNQKMILGLFNKFWTWFALPPPPQIYYSVQKMSTDSDSHPLFPVAQLNNETKNI